MTSLDVFEPIGQPEESTAGIKHGSVLCNETVKSSAPIANQPLFLETIPSIAPVLVVRIPRSNMPE